MLKDLLAQFLKRVVSDIESGNCNMSEEDMQEVFEHVQRLTAGNVLLTKYEACNHLHVSRATFDRLVASGDIPQGKHKVGTHVLFWTKKDLEKFKRE